LRFGMRCFGGSEGRFHFAELGGGGGETLFGGEVLHKGGGGLIPSDRKKRENRPERGDQREGTFKEAARRNRSISCWERGEPLKKKKKKKKRLQSTQGA